MVLAELVSVNEEQDCGVQLGNGPLRWLICNAYMMFALRLS